MSQNRWSGVLERQHEKALGSAGSDNEVKKRLSYEDISNLNAKETKEALAEMNDKEWLQYQEFVQARTAKHESDTKRLTELKSETTNRDAAAIAQVKESLTNEVVPPPLPENTQESINTAPSASWQEYRASVSSYLDTGLDYTRNKLGTLVQNKEKGSDGIRQMVSINESLNTLQSMKQEILDIFKQQELMEGNVAFVTEKLAKIKSELKDGIGALDTQFSKGEDFANYFSSVASLKDRYLPELQQLEKSKVELEKKLTEMRDMSVNKVAKFESLTKGETPQEDETPPQKTVAVQKGGSGRGGLGGGSFKNISSQEKKGGFFDSIKKIFS